MIAWYRRLVTSVSCILGLLVLVLAAPAKATPEIDELVRTYPAVMCQVWGPDVVSGVDKSAGYSQFGKLVNKNSAHSLDVVCPIIRKENAGTLGLQYVIVYFLDRHPLIDLRCTVYSVDVNGETLYASETQAHGGASELFQRFFFRDIDISVVHNPENLAGSMYMLFCSIPPKVGKDGFSWIGSYSVREVPEDFP